MTFEKIYNSLDQLINIKVTQSTAGGSYPIFSNNENVVVDTIYFTNINDQTLTQDDIKIKFKNICVQNNENIFISNKDEYLSYTFTTQIDEMIVDFDLSNYKNDLLLDN